MKNKRTGDGRKWKRYCIPVAIMSMNIIAVSGFARDSIKKESSVHFLYYAEAVSDEEIEYEYDDLNRVVKATYPDGTVILYEYDKNGNMLHTTVLPPEEPETTETGGGTEAGTDDGTGSGAEGGTGSGAESGTGSGEEGGTGSGTDDGAGSGTDDGIGSGTDDGTGSGAESGTGSGAEGGTGNGADGEAGNGTDSEVESGTDDETEPDEAFGQGKQWLAVILGAVAVIAAFTAFLRGRLGNKKSTKEEGEEKNEE